MKDIFDEDYFDEDYFERGIETGKSLYSGYYWMPKRTFKIARAFLKEMNVNKEESIIDYGTAKGFFVKALRKLNYEAFGIDISKYAVSHADLEIKKYIFLSTKKNYDVGFAKDVCEHIFSKKSFEKMLKEMKTLAKRWLVVVPLGDGKKYIIPEYDEDESHFIKQTKEWWVNIFKKNGFEIIKTKYRIKGIKDNWYDLPKGNHKGNLFLNLKLKEKNEN